MYFSQAGQDQFILNVLKGKKNGFYLEIGTNDPIFHNNTYTLEKNYNWKGILVEQDSTFVNLYEKNRPNSIYIINDATKIDYKTLFETTKMPYEMDYLQIDLDVDNRSTLTVLENLNNDILDKYKFATVTFEHDIYNGNYYNTREISRNIFSEKGYICVFKDVHTYYNNSLVVFEDWYVHPELVDMQYVNKLISNNINNYVYNEITQMTINGFGINYE
jgi:hypothetical protein